MMAEIRVRITVDGAERLQRWLAAAPAEMERGLHSATSVGTSLIWGAVRARTRVRTGALVASEQMRVEDRAGGVRGIVFSNIRYAQYREHGGRGGADHMFRRGLSETKEAAYHLYDIEARRLVDHL